MWCLKRSFRRQIEEDEIEAGKMHEEAKKYDRIPAMLVCLWPQYPKEGATYRCNWNYVPDMCHKFIKSTIRQ